MTQEEKQLLLVDLSARLPYGVKVESVFINPDTKEHKSWGIEVFNATSLLMIRDGLGEFKPYLFPLSSMNLDQRIEYSRTLVIFDESHCSQTSETYDWLNKNHFDYRNLIEKGLAIDCTNLNIY